MTAPRHVLRILTRLRKTYGARPRRTWGNGVDVLVETILSQNTSNRNSAAAYRQLRRQFPTWNLVADAPTDQVERWIRVAGLSRLKAPRIQNILRQLRSERGRITLEFLRRQTPEQAIAYLQQFKGIGPKTIDCLLLFAFAMPVFPVDTHIHRIARRLRWIGPKVSAEKAHDLLEPAIPPKHRYEMHVLLIDHGRAACKAINPRCLNCPILQFCPHGQSRMRAQSRGLTLPVLARFKKGLTPSHRFCSNPLWAHYCAPRFPKNEREPRNIAHFARSRGVIAIEAERDWLWRPPLRRIVASTDRHEACFI